MNYSIKEASEFLEVSVDTVRRRIKEGKIDAHKVEGKNGLQWMIPESELTGNNAAQIIEVIPVKREITPETMQNYIRQAMEEVGMQHKEELNELKEEVKSLNLTVQDISKALETALENLKTKQEEEISTTKKWWKWGKK